MTTQTELAELVKSLRLHWIDQAQDEEADAEEKCCYLIGTAAADALEHQARRIAELEKAAKAVIDRWDISTRTQGVMTGPINRLREALK